MDDSTIILISVTALCFCGVLLAYYIARNRKVKKEIIAKEQYFMAATEGNMDGFFILSAEYNKSGGVNDFIFNYLNPVAEKQIGLSKEQIIAHKLCDILPMIRFSAIFDRYIEVLASGRSVEEEFAISPVSDRVIWLRQQIIPIGGGIAVSSRDITESKKIDEKSRELSLALENVAEGMAYLDSNSRHIAVNPTYAANTGYEAHELIGVVVENLIHTDDRSSFAKALNIMMTSGKSEIEIRVLRVSGGVYYTNTVMVASYDHARKFIGYYCFMKDISARKEMERMKSEFISTVSHELRTPLTAIRGSLGLITGNMQSDISARVASLLGVAYKNCDRLIALINDILDMEKMDSGNASHSVTEINLVELIRNALESNQGYADQYGVTFDFPKAAKNNSVTVSGNYNRLMQVMANLLSNAAKFSPARGKVKIRITQKDKHAIVSIADEGCGVPEAFHGSIFSKFAQADSSDAREKGGTGLGLNISKSIIEAHGGRIWFANNKKSGATFYFELGLVTGSL